jgi:hypothetical protein
LSVATTHFTYYCHPNKSLFLVGATTTTWYYNYNSITD